MRIDIGHINKRVNSTKQTFTRSFSNVQVTLKEPTSIITPTFLLKNTNSNGYKFSEKTNYIYVPDWGYYWIMDIIYETNDLIKFVCARDVLATGKDYISKVDAYVKYCSDAAIATHRGVLDDDRFGPELYLGSSYTNLYTTPTGSGESLMSSLLTHNFSSGTIILSTMAQGGGMIRWFLDLTRFVDVMKAMATEAAGSSSYDQFCAKFFGSDWKSCVTSAYWVPFKLTEYESIFTNTDNVLAGVIQVTAATAHYTMVPSYGKCNAIRRTLPFIDICNKPRYEFLKGPKYTSVTFQYAGGTIDISNDALTDFSQVLIEETADLFTGDLNIKIYATDANGVKGPMLGQIQDSLGVDFSPALSYIPSSSDQALNMLTSMYKGALSAGSKAFLGGASMTEPTLIGHTEETESSEVEDSPKMSNKTLSKAANLASGILGSFDSFEASPVGRQIGAKSNICSYFTDKLDGTNATDLYRISCSTMVPSAFFDEPTGPQTPSDNILYTQFCDLYGWPCNKYVTLGNVRTGNYIQCVGANAGNVQTSDITWSLTTKELASLNSLLNSGIYYE